MRGNCTPVRIQEIEYLWVTADTESITYRDHQIQSCQGLLVLSETFPNQPFYAITLDGITSSLDRHSGSETRIIQIICNGQHCH